MLRRLTVVLIAGLTVFLGLLANPASASPPETITNTAKGVVENFVDIVPSCEEDGELYDITITVNRIEHETLFDDGRVHATFTDTGTFVAVPLDGTGPSFTGKFTVWGGFNQNGTTVNGTFTFNIHGTGSDGSTFSVHNLDHFNVTPDGTVNEFFRCH